MAQEKSQALLAALNRNELEEMYVEYLKAEYPEMPEKSAPKVVCSDFLISHLSKWYCAKAEDCAAFLGFTDSEAPERQALYNFPGPANIKLLKYFKEAILTSPQIEKVTEILGKDCPPELLSAIERFFQRARLVKSYYDEELRKRLKVLSADSKGTMAGILVRIIQQNALDARKAVAESFEEAIKAGTVKLIEIPPCPLSIKNPDELGPVPSGPLDDKAEDVKKSQAKNQAKHEKHTSYTFWLSVGAIAIVAACLAAYFSIRNLHKEEL